MENVHEKRLGQPFTVELLNRELQTNRLSRTCAYLFFILGISVRGYVLKSVDAVVIIKP